MASFAATRTETRTASAVAESSKTWAWWGVAASILGLLVTWSIQFLVGEDALKVGGQTLIDDLDTTSTQAIYRVSSGLGFIVVAMLIPFSIGLYRHLNAKAEGKSTMPAIISISFLITAAFFAVSMSFRAQVFDGLTYYTSGTENHVTIQRLQQDTVLTTWSTLLAAVTCVTIGGLKGNLFPKGLGIFSGIVLVAMVALLLGGVAFPAGAMAALPWFIVFSIWAVRQPALD